MPDVLRACPPAATMALAALIAMTASGWGRAAAPSAASGSGTSATAWGSFREGERLVKSGDLEGAFRAYALSREAMLPASVDPSLAEALAVNLYNLAGALSSANRVDLSLKCFIEFYRLRQVSGRIRDDAFERTVRAGAERIAAYAVAIGRAGEAIPVYVKTEL